MHAIKIVISPQEFDKFVKKHLDKQNAERYADCEWIPAVIKTTDLLQIEVLAVPAEQEYI